MENSRDNILNKIRTTLDNNKEQNRKFKDADDNQHFFISEDKSLELKFANALQSVDGKFIYCMDQKDLIESLQQIAIDEKWENVYCSNPDLQELLLASEIPFTSSKDDFKQMHVAISGCEFLIAEFGSIMVSSNQPSGRQIFVYPPVHIIVAYTSQLVVDIQEALNEMKNKYKNTLPSSISLITGPSRTADIEKTLILGAHGPKELFVFLVNDSN